MTAGTVIEARGLTTRLGGEIIHRDLDLAVRERELLAVAGSSGSGKTVLLRALTLLQPLVSGEIHLLGRPTAGLARSQGRLLRQRMGVMFQRGALFTGMSVLENVMFPLREHTRLPARLAREVALLKIRLVGLERDAALLRPNELSGGMTKRAALARALVLDPALLFLDEPTAGLDPVGAADFDALIRRLQALLNLTVVVVTHDVDSLWAIADRVAFLGDGRVLDLGTMDELAGSEQPEVRAFFEGSRMQRAEERGVGNHPPATHLPTAGTDSRGGGESA